MKIDRLIDYDGLSEEQWEVLFSYIHFKGNGEIAMLTSSILLFENRTVSEGLLRDKVPLEKVNFLEVKRLLSSALVFNEYKRGLINPEGHSVVNSDKRFLGVITGYNYSTKEKDKVREHMSTMIKRAEMWDKVSLGRVYLEWEKYCEDR